MNRRQLFALGAGLIVGEPARRAYSFLNGHGLELLDWRAAARARMITFLQSELKKHFQQPLSRMDRVTTEEAVQGFLDKLILAEPSRRVVSVRYNERDASIKCVLQLPPFP